MTLSRLVGLQRVFLDSVMNQWAMGLFTNDARRKYQLVAHCHHPDISKGTGDLPLPLTSFWSPAWPFDLNSALLQFEEVFRLIDVQLD